MTGRLKKAIGVVLAFAVAASQCYAGAAPVSLAADRTDVREEVRLSADRFFYGQLNDDAKKIYDAMYEMYEGGAFKTGNGDLDLAAKGYVSQEQLTKYSYGDEGLLSAMGAARDAFCADYPDIFYVDFSYLSIRVTNDSVGSFHAWLGPGRSDSYYTRGFSDASQVDAAIAEYEERIGEIVSEAKKVEAGEGETLTEARIKFVHDKIIKNASYRLEDGCKKENIGLIRTAYGVLVKGEGACEGYSRAMKAVLDRMGISCILVHGAYRADAGSANPHMWNYVRPNEDGPWYAVDATMDDPIAKTAGDGGEDGYENTEFLLAGEDVMSRRHIPSGIMSEAEFEFKYPDISMAGSEFKRIYSSKDGLEVLFNKDGTYDGLDAGIFKVSYNGMGYEKAARTTGKYIICRLHQYYEATGEWNNGDWGYLLPDVYSFEDTDSYIKISVPHCLYVEFGVTDIPPGDYLKDPNKTRFLGDPILLEEETGMIYNPNGDYVAPPYIKSLSPDFRTRIYAGRTYHIKAVYDDDLRLADGAAKIGYELGFTGQQSTAAKYTEIKNLEWDGKATIEFDFKPSEMWADEAITYNISFTGIVGKKSLKQPNPISYYASSWPAVCAYRSQGYYWNMFGKPALLENDSLSTKDWRTADGEAVSDDMAGRLVLVASSTANRQADEMNGMIEDSLEGGDVLKSETYNIDLVTCNKRIVQTGQSLRVSLGFPEGYGPDDAGVVFKAYHFSKDEYGEITGVEEIPCMVTPYGLVILCDSFSPFAIAAVKGGEAQKPDGERTVIFSNSAGGKIDDDDGVVSLAKGESKTVSITADEGYEIDAIAACGRSVPVSDKKSMTISLDYDDAFDSVSMARVDFVSESTIERDESRGEALAEQKAEPAHIDLGTGDINVYEGEAFKISAKVDGDGLHSYQWYKDGKPLYGSKGLEFSVESASAGDSGRYSLMVETVAGAIVERAWSDARKVTVLKKSGGSGGGSSGMVSSGTPTPGPTADVGVSNPGGAGEENNGKGDAELGGSSGEPSAGGDEQKSERPGRVLGLKAEYNRVGAIKIKWDEDARASGYQVLCCGGKKGEFVRVADTKKTSYTDKKCKPGRARRYKVVAYVKDGGSEVFGEASDELGLIAKPKPPKILSCSRVNKKTASISLKAVENASSYRIYRYDGNGGKYDAAYKIKGKRLYVHRGSGWKRVGTVRRSGTGNTIKCSISNLNKKSKKISFAAKTVVSIDGYATAYSKIGKKTPLREN